MRGRAILQERRIVGKTAQELAYFGAGRLAEDERPLPVARCESHTFVAYDDPNITIGLCRPVTLLNASRSRRIRGAARGH